MRTDDFSFELPEELIAQHPPERRGESRLMVLDRALGRARALTVARLAGFPRAGDPDGLQRFPRAQGANLRRGPGYGSRTEFLLLTRRPTEDAGRPSRRSSRGSGQEGAMPSPRA